MCEASSLIHHSDCSAEYSGIVVCPCGETYVHIESVEVNRNGNVAYTSDRGTRTHNNGEKTRRGSRTSMVFNCESGCRFVLEIQFHKGNTYVAVRLMQPKGNPGDLWRD